MNSRKTHRIMLRRNMRRPHGRETLHCIGPASAARTSLVQAASSNAPSQFTTVLGVTKISGLVHPDQHVRNATQNSLCRAVNRRRGCCACRASNCRRRARFSRTRSSRERKALTNQPRKIMARILAEKSESSSSPSHSFCRCTTFWRSTPDDSGTT